jgi:hypothetical protein
MKIYRHLKTNKPYLKVLKSKAKINGIWSPCIIYLCLYWNKDGMLWVRLEDDFNQNFK